MKKRRRKPFFQRLDEKFSDNRWGLVVVLLALVLKLFYVIESARSLHANYPILDSLYYDNMAREVLSGKLIRDEAFYMGPLYPYFIAGVYGIFGKSFLLVRILQMLAGTATVFLTYLLGRRLFGPAVGLCAALLLTFYGTVTFYEGQMLMMWLGTLLGMTILFVLFGSPKRGGLGRFALAGFLAGLSALARANILLLVPVVLLWILFFSDHRRRLAKSAVFVASVLVTLLPATAHNLAASGEFIPITWNGGVNFFIGNNAEATGAYSPPKGTNFVSDPTTRSYVEAVSGRDVRPGEIARYWYKESWNFIRDNTGAELRLLAKKAGLFVNAYEMPQIESYDVERSRYTSLKILFVNFWFLVSFGILGMIFSAGNWRRYFLLYGFVVAFALSIIVFFVTARYRAQMAPVFCLFAAYAILVVIPTALRNFKRGWIPLATCAVIIFLARPGMFDLSEGAAEASHHANQAMRLARANRLPEALNHATRAIELQPEHAPAYISRAIVRRASGDLSGAIEDYELAIEYAADERAAHVRLAYIDLAGALRQAGRDREAIPCYQKAISLDPAQALPYYQLGMTYRDLKQLDDAITVFEKVLEIDPGYTKVYNNLAVCYADLDQIETAIETLERATRVDPEYPHSYRNLGMLYQRVGRSQDAIDAYQRYLRLKPDDRTIRERLQKMQASGTRR